MDRVFTEQQLKQFDGSSRKRPAYIAYHGIVYDVSSNSHWRDGLHRNLHFAGQDLTDELADSPHGDVVFSKLPIVGVFKREG
jgi:predicted heme/steroid binding protein